MKTIQVKAGEVVIGGDAPIVVQTMCNTHTQDIAASVEQCEEMVRAGARMIRLTTQGLKEVEALASIKKELRSRGITVPLVADVHFSPEVAKAAAGVADKVRINPGNFSADPSATRIHFAEFIEICKEHGTAVRIGLNHGSLGERIIRLYGDTPLGMKEAAMEWLNMCRENDFYNVTVSLKASNTLVMVTAYRLLKEEMERQGILFPLHLGVTEAGNGDMGRIKSAVGIGALLQQGIGNTIRVSLTENPVREIPAALTIARYYDSGRAEASLREIRMQLPGIPRKHYVSEDWNQFIIEASCDFGPLLLDKTIDDFEISCLCGGHPAESEPLKEFKENLLQAARRKFTRPEYIACPGCGRTLYDLEKTFNEVKKRTSHLQGLRIAVMGCIVNGPSEMADADYGYVGEGKGKVAIYRGKEPVLRRIPQEQAIDALLKIIEEDTVN